MVKVSAAGGAEEAVDIVVDEAKPGANKINAGAVSTRAGCQGGGFDPPHDGHNEVADVVFSGADLAPWRADRDHLSESTSGARIV